MKQYKTLEELLLNESLVKAMIERGASLEECLIAMANLKNGILERWMKAIEEYGPSFGITRLSPEVTLFDTHLDKH